jgi:hypothetical protein
VADDGPDGRLQRAVARIDAVNADDPNTLVVDGVERPKEQAHAELMTAWVQRLDPDADDAQLLAARAHHLRRWSIPRADFPEGRAGYLRWRRTLNRQHADEVAEILEGEGYGPEVVAEVQGIIRKEHLKTDPKGQVHEDALCLVFLSTQLGPLAEQLAEQGPGKAEDVLHKTVAKMTPRGRRLATELGLGDPLQPLVDATVAAVEAEG